MNNNENSKKKNKKTNNTGTRTFSIASIDGSVVNPYVKDDILNPQYYEIYKKIIELETQNQQLTTQVKNLNSNVSSIRKKENRLLNRFGWTLIMANILLGVLAVMVVLGYFQFFIQHYRKI